MRTQDEIRARLLEAQLSNLMNELRHSRNTAHAGVFHDNFTGVSRLEPFAPAPEPEQRGASRALRTACDELAAYGTAERHRILLNNTGLPAAGVYYAASAPYVPLVDFSASGAEPPPLVIPLPTFEDHVYALVPDGRLRVLARRDGAAELARDDTFAPGEWPAPCRVAEELLYLLLLADVCGYGRLMTAQPVLSERCPLTQERSRRQSR